MNPSQTLAFALIRRRSVTPADDGCLAILAGRLERLGFACETFVSGPPDLRVTNLWAVKRGTAQRAGKLLAFAGHTDVVPPGPIGAWTSDPFSPVVRDGRLYGRGAADMKTAIACFVIATEEFVRRNPSHGGSIAFLITGDEEGPGVDGTVKVVELLKARGECIDYCLIGEPTSVSTLGDTVKQGRRGTLSGALCVHGVQGHVAYPDLAENPIHRAIPPLAELAAQQWDAGDEYFPPTSWQISNIHAGSGANNVIPGSLSIDFNFRFSKASTAEDLKERVRAILDRHNLRYDIAWTLGGEPFLTLPGELMTAITDAIHAVVGVETTRSTSGGTSDGRFIARICPQVVEFGPPNGSIHKVDEYIEVALIEPLKNIYL
ncbi:succinyl-diaminopimelate desuccinylase (plasmid) [Cupriavidus basilensis]